MVPFKSLIFIFIANYASALPLPQSNYPFPPSIGWGNVQGQQPSLGGTLQLPQLPATGGSNIIGSSTSHSLQHVQSYPSLGSLQTTIEGLPWNWKPSGTGSFGNSGGIGGGVGGIVGGNIGQAPSYTSYPIDGNFDLGGNFLDASLGLVQQTPQYHPYPNFGFGSSGLGGGIVGGNIGQSTTYTSYPIDGNLGGNFLDASLGVVQQQAPQYTSYPIDNAGFGLSGFDPSLGIIG